jgi:uroporphyrinogen decarboxylase
MNSRERVLAAMQLEQPDMVPFFDNVDQVVQKRVVGKDFFDPYEFTETMHFDAMDYNGFTPPSFVRTESAAGTTRRIQVEGLIKKRDDLKQVKLPALTDHFFEKARIFIDRYGKTDKALFFRCRTGSASVLQSMGLDGFSYALYDDPGLIETLFDLYVDWITRLVSKAQTMGFDFAWFADDIAYKNGPMFSPKVFRQIFLPRMHQVASCVKLPWFYHSDGDLMPLMEDLLSLGMSGLNPIEPEAMDIVQVKEKYGKRVCIMGNVSLNILGLGTPQDVEREVERLIRVAGKGGGYILASGNSIPDYCKLENVLALRDAVEMYRRY